MKSDKGIAALVSVFVLFSFIAGGGISGFAVAASCTGTPVLHLAPNPAQASQLVLAKVTGLKNCFGAEVLLKDETQGSRCSGDTIASYQCRGVGCDNSVSFAPNTARDYVIAACIDKDYDGYYLSQNEHSLAALKVISLPDLAVSGLKFSPARASAGQPIIATAAISNKGVVTATSFTYMYELFRAGQVNTVYKYTNEYNDFPSKTKIVLAAGEVKQVAMPAVSLGAGEYRVKLSLDFRERFNEADETNNIYETTLTVY